MTPAPAPEAGRLVNGWQLVALAAVVMAGLVGGLLLIEPAERMTLMRGVGSTVAPSLGMILAACAAVVAAWAARQTKQETARQTPLIETAVRQTNGINTALTAERDALRAKLDAVESQQLTDARGRPAEDAGGYDTAAALVSVNVGGLAPGIIP